MTETKLDKDSAAIVSRSQSIKDMVGSDGWKHARRCLFERLVELDSVDAMLMDRSAEDIKMDLLSRKSVIGIIRGWLTEIEGEAASVDHTVKAFTDERKDDIILELDKQG